MNERSVLKATLSICAAILLGTAACSEAIPTSYPATQTLTRQLAPTFPQQGQISYVYEGVLYLINPNGSGKHIVDDGGISFKTVSWAPSYSQVVYHSASRGGLVLRDIQTGNTELIAREESIFITSTPKWSPDGRLLIYATHNPGKTPVTTIQMYDVSRKELKILADRVGNPVSADYVIWGASQDELLIMRSDIPFRSLGTIFRYDPLSHSEEQLAKGAFPVYSPDSTRILYASKTSYGLTDIAPVTYYFNLLPDPENQLPELVRESYPLLYAPVWAPDGQGFAYKCIGDELWCNGARGIRSKRDQAYILYYSFNAASPKVLATNANLPDDHLIRYWPPDYGFSPDGQFFVYSGWTDESDSALFLLNLATGSRTTLDVAPVGEMDGVKELYPRHEFVSWLED